MKDHVKKEHFKNALVKCPDCKFSGTKGNVQSHYGRIHCKNSILKKRNKYECVNCQKTFKSETSCYHHISKCVGLYQKVGSGGKKVRYRC